LRSPTTPRADPAAYGDIPYRYLNLCSNSCVSSVSDWSRDAPGGKTLKLSIELLVALCTEIQQPQKTKGAGKIALREGRQKHNYLPPSHIMSSRRPSEAPQKVVGQEYRNDSEKPVATISKPVDHNNVTVLPQTPQLIALLT